MQHTLLKESLKKPFFSKSRKGPNSEYFVRPPIRFVECMVILRAKQHASNSPIEHCRIDSMSWRVRSLQV